jgi:hypothetical protein
MIWVNYILTGIMLRKGTYPNMAVCQFIAPVHWYQVIAMKMQPASNGFFLAIIGDLYIVCSWL